jgi:spermidine synthase
MPNGFVVSEMHTKNVKLSIKVDKQLFSGESEFQRIDVFDSPEFGKFLTLDGYMMLTEKTSLSITK